MLNFILHNPIFEILLGSIIFINFALTMYLDSKEMKNDYKELKNSDIVTKTKAIILLIFTIIGIIVLFFKFPKNFLAWIIIITIFICLLNSIKKVYKDDKNFTVENKYENIISTIIFIILFAAHTTNIYINELQYINDTTKEILLLIYLNLKIISFIFFILINTSVLISNINEILPINLKNGIKKVLQKTINNIKIINYDFKFYNNKKSKKNLIIDSLIFTFLCPISIIIISVYLLIIKFFICIRNLINYIIKELLLFNSLRNKITKKTTQMSIIISLILSYIIIITTNDIFSNEIKECFDLISTVILIPIIYDNIKTNKS